MLKNNLLLLLCVLAIVVIVLKVSPFKVELFDADVMKSNGWTQYTKPNYYGFGTWGYHYGDPYYYRKGEELTYED